MDELCALWSNHMKNESCKLALLLKYSPQSDVSSSCSYVMILMLLQFSLLCYFKACDNPVNCMHTQQCYACITVINHFIVL